MITEQQILDWISKTTMTAQSIAPISKTVAESYPNKEVIGIKFPSSPLGPEQLLDQLRIGLADVDIKYDVSIVEDSKTISGIESYLLDELSKGLENCADPIESQQFSPEEWERAIQDCAEQLDKVEITTNELIEALCPSPDDPPVSIDVIPDDIDSVISTEVDRINDLTKMVTDPDRELEGTGAEDYADAATSDDLTSSIPDGFKKVLEDPSEFNPDEANRSLDITVDQELTDVIDSLPEEDNDTLSNCQQKTVEMTESLNDVINRYSEIKIQIEDLKLKFRYAELQYTFYNSASKVLNSKDPKVKDIINRIRLLNTSIKPAVLGDFVVESKLKIEDKNNLKKINELINSTFGIDIEITFSSLYGAGGVQKILDAFSSALRFENERGRVSFSIDKKKEEIGVVIKAPKEFQKTLDSIDRTSETATQDILGNVDVMQKKIDDVYNSTVGSMISQGIVYGVKDYPSAKNADQEQFTKNYLVITQEYESLKSQYEALVEENKQLEEQINSFKNRLQEELIKLGCEPIEKVPTVEPGSNLNFKTVSRNPIPTDYSWWVKFCQLATIVNLVPVHWPVGIIIPIPFGLLKIPCPIIWFPLVVIPNPISLTVVLIGQCGILPSPFVYFMHFLPVPIGPMKHSDSWFPVAIRPMKKIVSPTENRVLDASPKVTMFGARVEVNPEFTKTMPIVRDDLPVWERLSLDNIPFLLFLWNWCSAGKRGGGFFEYPF